MTEPSTPHRILLATIECIEAVGIDALTVRMIAQRAGVNVALISYHFGNKKALLDAVLASTIHQAFAQPLVDFDLDMSQHGDMRAALFRLVDELILGALTYPRIAFAHFRDPIVTQQPDTLLQRELTAFLDGLVERLGPHLPEHPDLPLALAQMWATMLTVSLTPHLFDGVTGRDLSKSDNRKAWVDALFRAQLRI